MSDDIRDSDFNKAAEPEAAVPGGEADEPMQEGPAGVVVPTGGEADEPMEEGPAGVVVPDDWATEPARWRVPYSGPTLNAWLTDRAPNLLLQARTVAATVSERQRENVAQAAAGRMPVVPDISAPGWQAPHTFKICLCTTSFCRGRALIKSLAINLVTLQMYVGLVHWVVVSFEDDIGDHELVKEWIYRHAKWAIEGGLL
ncbi:MAG: hypothetical protein GY772_07690, partial [bacterium]|nr:hypothetical protein [bacterium]